MSCGPHTSVAVIGDDAIGLLAVLTAKRRGAKHSPSSAVSAQFQAGLDSSVRDELQQPAFAGSEDPMTDNVAYLDRLPGDSPEPPIAQPRADQTEGSACPRTRRLVPGGRPGTER